MATKMSVMMDIISPEHSRPLRILERLSFICQPMSMTFKSMCSLLGDCITWDSDTCSKLLSSVLIFCGHIWRRLIHYYDAWPWKMSLVVDDRVDARTQRKLAEEFLDSADGDRDVGCSDKIYAWLRSHYNTREQRLEALLEPSSRLRRFISKLFCRMIAASTHIEDAFAGVRQFLSKGRPPCPSTLGAYFVANQSHRAWCTEAVKSKPVRSKCQQRKRPLWVRKRSQRVGGKNRKSAYTRFLAAKLQAGHAGSQASAAPSEQGLRFQELSRSDLTAFAIEGASLSRAFSSRLDPITKEIAAAEGALQKQKGTPWGVGTEIHPLHADYVDSGDATLLHEGDSFI